MPPLPHEVLSVVARRVPAALVSAEALTSILDYSRRLPPAFNWLGFECRLATDDPRVDFAGCCEAWNGGRKKLERALTNSPELLGPGPTALIREWADPGSLLFRASPAVWLEFDFLGGAPVPFAFLCLDPACADTFFTRSEAPPPPSDVLLAAAERGATLLCERGTCPGLAVLRRCVAALPPGARALHVAATPHRGTLDLRLHFALSADEVPGWLRAIDWPGDHASVADALALLGVGFRQVGVQLDAGAALRPMLGLEAYVSHGPAEFDAWSQALAALEAAGLCDPRKSRAVFDWWGHELASLPSTSCRVHLVRQFYLKLSLNPGALAAKMYLAIFTRNAAL